jgi:hypothetical protein
MKSTFLSFSLALVFALICLVTCDVSLSLFLAAFFGFGCLLPPLVVCAQTSISRVLTAVFAFGGIALIWIVAAFKPDVTLVRCLECFLILIGFATLITGCAIALVRVRIAPLAASAITTMVSLIWLTAPVWLASNLSDTGVARLVWIHPLFAINGVLSNLDAWSHFPIAYRELTTLGQDIPYSLPTSIWPSFLAHFIPGLVLWWLASWRVSGVAEPSASAPSSTEGQS